MLSSWKLCAFTIKKSFRSPHFRFSSTGNSNDPHNTLGLKKNATSGEIKNAYLRLSKKFHPDVNRDPKAVETYKNINAAYEILKNSTGSTSKSPNSNTQERYADPHTYEKQKYSSKKEEPIRDEESLYESIFGKSYQEDPSFYYKNENEHLRQRYEEQSSKFRQARGQTYEEPKPSDSSKSEKGYRNFEENFEQETSTKSEKKTKELLDPKILTILAGSAVALISLVFYLAVRKEKEEDTNGNSIQDVELEKVRDIALKAEGEKKERQRQAVLSNVAQMKIYPKQNPEAISMLVDYTIWNDLRFFSLHHTYFYKDVEKLANSDDIEKTKIFNTRLNTKLTLSLEAERVLKNVYVPVNTVLAQLQENGFYKPPTVFMRYFGFLAVKIRQKPIVAENLKEAINQKEQYISLFDLFWRYTTPVLLANYDYMEFNISHSKYIPDTTTKEDIGWLGNVTINHRPLSKKILKGDEKNVFVWQGKDMDRDDDYIRSWLNYYDVMKKTEH